MSFLEYKDCPEAGDTVIVYLSFKLFYPLILKAGEVFQTKYGALRHDDVIGRPYGSRINVKSGFVHCLWPTPELWTLALPHRTQILYARDISLTIFQLDLHPGSVVVESGTGSGSLTHSLARAVAPHGKVFTFDFHQGRSETAQREFVSHGLGDVVTCAHRDVCADGFGLVGVADAVFLDLPHPWLAVHHAIEALKDSGGRICSFSPCIEQVQRTCQRLRELRCVEVTTLECLERPYEVKKVHLVKQNVGADRHGHCAEYFTTALGSDERTHDDQLTEAGEKTGAINDSDNEKNENSSSFRGHMELKGEDDEHSVDDSDTALEAKLIKQSAKRTTKDARREKSLLPGETRLCAVPSVKVPGHTGYLTFATFLGQNQPEDTQKEEVA